jgi:hypothetical protein
MKQNSFKNFYMRRTNLLLWLLIQHLDTSTMFYRSTTIGFVHMSILYTPVNLKFSVILGRFVKHRCWRKTNYSINIDAGGKLTTQLYDKRDDFSFTIVNFPYIWATSHYHLHTGYTSLNWFDMQGPALHTISVWVGVDYWQASWCYRDFYSLVWCQRFASSRDVTVI